jgi:hypothetical protein
VSDVPVQINLRNGRGEVLVAGHDIGSAVTGFTLEGEPGDPARLTLTIPTLEWDSGKTTVLFVPVVHDALVAMGWTPPGEDA